jgi:aminoglycoside phosphotransferase (APT) family kinase protein
VLVGPQRLDALLEAVGVERDEDVRLVLTGWAKHVLIAERVVVLAPRNHTMVEALERELAALDLLAAVPGDWLPRVDTVVRDEHLGPYPFVVCDRLPGEPLDELVESISADDLVPVFEQLGRRIASWQRLPVPAPARLRQRDLLGALVAFGETLDLTRAERSALRAAEDAAGTLAPVLVHGDIHEGQLLVDPASLEVTGVVDWSTARLDHPFSDFDLGEWGTGLWRSHRPGFEVLLRAAWAGRSAEVGHGAELGPTLWVLHLVGHLRRLVGDEPFPVQHQSDVVGTATDLRRRLAEALAGYRPPS